MTLWGRMLMLIDIFWMDTLTISSLNKIKRQNFKYLLKDFVIPHEEITFGLYFSPRLAFDSKVFWPLVKSLVEHRSVFNSLELVEKIADIRIFRRQIFVVQRCYPPPHSRSFHTSFERCSSAHWRGVNEPPEIMPLFWLSLLPIPHLRLPWRYRCPHCVPSRIDGRRAFKNARSWNYTVVSIVEIFLC